MPAARPGVLAVAPISHSGLHGLWPQWKRGHVEVAAAVLELFPKAELYATGRDALWLHDALALAVRDDAAALARLHILEISSKSAAVANLGFYLEQEGLSATRLAAGTQYIVVDVNFSGGTPRAMRQCFDALHASQIRGYFLCAANAENTSSRVFLTAMDSRGAHAEPMDFLPYLAMYESLPKWTPKTLDYVKRDGRWRPVLASTNEDWFDGVVAPEEHLRYMQDLAYYFALPTTRAKLARRRRLWRTAIAMAYSGEIEALRRLLARLALRGGPMGEAFARDFVEHHQDVVSTSDASLSVAMTNAAYYDNTTGLALRFPAWRAVLTDPERHVPQMAAAGRYRELQLLAAAASGEHVKRVLRDTLLAHREQAREVVQS
jgi:hypothetical protein